MLLQDLRHSVRSLWHTKGFAAVAIACLGLGIGLNTTIFSIIDGVMLKPYPFHEPDRIRVVRTSHPDQGGGVSLKDLQDWKAATSSFTTIAAVMGRSATIVDGAGEPERYLSGRITWDLFRMLGVEPMLGRDVVESDDQSNAAGVVIPTYAEIGSEPG